eukprot:Phypoly_transcript_10750.p1 GENE.Phypoly_transcript_10750~~Phypoly_transcript_10750.p1  ORF type:complete len:388 (+),score=59.92 Phypoly_transcript_10750:66-1229(+)
MLSMIFYTLAILCLYITGSTSFVIYADNSLFEYPPYNYTQAFEQFAGLPAGTVKLVALPDIDLVDKITGHLSGDLPDVVIGLNNIYQYNLPQNTFLPYNSPQIQFIDPHLYAQVSQFNLIPYEYGRVTIIGNNTRIGTKYDPSTITLHNITSNTDILRSLIVQDPSKGETAAAFLLGSIAAFGDSKAGIVGEVSGTDWQTWWKTVLAYSRVEDTWESAWALFQNSTDYSLMVSYELDPSYFACTKNESDIIALNLENDQWYLIHSIGIHNKTSNETLAQQFVDWWLSLPIQTLIPDHEWVFPARNNVTIPSCFKTNVSPNPQFNEILNSTTITQNYNSWISEWTTLNAKPAPTSSTSSTTNGAATSSATMLYFSGMLVLVWIFAAFF